MDRSIRLVPLPQSSSDYDDTSGGLETKQVNLVALRRVLTSGGTGSDLDNAFIWRTTVEGRFYWSYRFRDPFHVLELDDADHRRLWRIWAMEQYRRGTP